MMVQPLMTLEQVGAKRVGIHRGGIQQKYFLSDSQRRILLERYDGRTETIDELMHYFPGYPRHVIRKWGRELGLARQKEPRWTEEDEAYLERNLHRKSLGDIAKHLGRTKTAVHLKAKRIGVNKTQEGYTMRGLCLGLGCDHHKVERWLDRGWIKGKRRQSERTEQQGGDMWLFTDSAIRDLVVNHPLEIDPRRCDWLWMVELLSGGLGSLREEKYG